MWWPTFAAIVATGQVGVSTFQPPLPALARRVALWNTTSGELLYESMLPPMHALFGSRPNYTNAPLMQASPEQACSRSTAAWNGHTVLGGDWDDGGCSIQVRAKVFEAAGASTAVFKGTEGVPFDWDGSETGNMQIAVFIVGYKDYEQLKDAAIGAASSALIVTLVPADSPLSDDQAFKIIERTIQILCFLLAFYVLSLAIWQLIRFYQAEQRLKGSSTKLQASNAKLVIGSELLATLSMIIYIIDGPFQEHTRPCLLPWIVHRMSLSLHVAFHMLASLIFSFHLRQIRRRVEDHSFTRAKPKDKLGRRRSSNILRDSMRSTRKARRQSQIQELEASGEPNARCSCTSSSNGLSSRYDGLFIVLIVLCIVFELVSSVLVGSYTVFQDFDFTLFTTGYVALVTFTIGAWFTWQSIMIVRALTKAEGEHGGGSSRVVTLSKNAKRMGVSKMMSIFFAVISEALRQALVQDGGMVYWWTLLPPWTILLFFMMLNSLFQILAFQPPAPKKIGTNERTTQIAQTRRATSRCSVSAAYLNDVVRNITKGKGGVGEIEERMRRASGVHGLASAKVHHNDDEILRCSGMSACSASSTSPSRTTA